MAKDGKSAKVHIMKDFRLKFFEMGTGDRYVTRRGTTALKKKAFRGRIEKGKYSFFLRAQQASREKVFGEMGMRVAEAVKKISDKKRT